MFQRKLSAILALFMIASLVFAPALTPTASAVEIPPTVSDGPEAHPPTATTSHRLIVELESPPLAVAFQSEVKAAGVDGKLDVQAASAQAYLAQLQAEQAAFVSQMQAALPSATVSTFLNETGAAEEAAYQVVFNGMSVDPGAADAAQAKAQLERMAGVKAVYADRAYATQLYTSTQLINAPAAWNSPAIGGIERAGAGIKVASMDGGVHKDAPMFDGTGYSYPPGYGPNGVGLTENNNGKIIASRVYFRTWDPPAPGDENPWPGENGTSHGVHTASTAAGNVVEDVDYLGYDVGTMSGVAPAAYVMSYRVFYASINGNDSFYTTEGLAALEDIVRDGADVVNNSWGEGPISEGGEFDPLDTALINASKAGVFVSMSAGNSGPNPGTGDHPSADYISVAASTTSGTLASGRVGVKDEPALQDLAFALSSFGGVLPSAQVFEYEFVPSDAVDPANILGCDPWPAGAFAGKAALIKRGECEFGVKVVNAEQAGAVFVIVYNHEDGGDELVSMAPGAVGDQATVSSIFIGNTDGSALVTYYNTNGPAQSILEIDTFAFQAGNTPDYLASFSSRGPAVGNVLKPDIAAPGVNILAQGYAPNTSGEDRHLGYGQVSGTSMAAPHVAGAAALLKQAYPSWPNSAIKSAMMSTSKYMDVYNADGSPAQPLDMGAGRLDIEAALDPGVLLDPPSLSFGTVVTGSTQTLGFMVTNVSGAAESYSVSTLYTGDGFTATTALPGFSATPALVDLGPGESATISVTVDTALSAGYGDNQGYIILQGNGGHEAHLPAWARVSYADDLADVLIIDNDFSDELGFADYLWYYTSTLEELGYSYNVVNTSSGVGMSATIPDATTLAAYKAVIWFTGDNYYPDGTFTVSTGLTGADQDRLVEYLNGGGTLIAMGQDLASVLDAATFDAEVGSRNFLYTYRLGANWVQDSVSGFGPPTNLIVDSEEAPAIFDGAVVDLTAPRKYTASGALAGENEVPPVATGTTGNFAVNYDVDQGMVSFAVTVIPTETTPITVTGAHIHEGAAGVNGPVLYNLADIDPEITLPTYVTTSLTLQGVFTITESSHVTALLESGLYINVHSTDNPSGEVRGQIEPTVVDNHLYIDEVDNEFHDNSQDPRPDGTTSESNLGSTPLLHYLGPDVVFNGTVALAHRDQPSLERPGIDYRGRSVYTTFGLEGMNNHNPDALTRAELLGTALSWAWSEPAQVLISDITAENASELTIFTASLFVETEDGTATLPTENIVSISWDFGDGTPYQGPFTTLEAGHQYLNCGTYTVRAAVTDIYGNVSIGSETMEIDTNCLGDQDSGPDTVLFLPIIPKEGAAR